MIHSQYFNRPLRWFLEPSRPGLAARYRGRESRGEDSMVFIPEHQRDYVWPVHKQVKLIQTAFKGYPIPSIMVSEDERNRYSVNDGQQRLETFWRYYTNQVAMEGKKFENLTDEEKKVFLDYMIPIVDTTGATKDQEAEIYDLLNQGVALSHGEKFWNRRSKPLVKLTEEMLLTRGQGLHAHATEVFGDYLASDDKRHKRMENAIAYVAGAAYGSEYITTSYAKLWDVLSETHDGVKPDEELVRARLTKLLDVYRAANAITPPTTKKAKSQWKVGSYSAYILHTIILHENDPEFATDVLAFWARIVASARQNAGVEWRLFRGTVKSANITLDKCDKVYNNVIEMMGEGVVVAEAVYEEDEEDEEDDE